MIHRVRITKNNFDLSSSVETLNSKLVLSAQKVDNTESEISDKIT